MSRNGYREVAAIANCLLCDTYFMLVVGVAPRAAELRGRKGTKILEDHLSKVSTHIYILKVLKSVQQSGIYYFLLVLLLIARVERCTSSPVCTHDTRA